MQSILALGAYGAAILLALYLLYSFHAKAWYWHALSILAALAIGIVPIGSLPIPEEWMARPEVSFVIGFLFVFLLLWGVGAPFFRAPHEGPFHKHA